MTASSSASVFLFASVDFKRYASLFFFFFQAEDGIRDTSVTGVQTCALPILGGARARVRSPCRQHPDPAGRRQHGEPASRSEERRVGKECRSRWARSE